MAFSFKNIFSSLQDSAPLSAVKTVGIDIGSSSVKVLELEETEKALVLKTYGELQLGPYGDAALGDVTKLAEKKRIEALVDVIRESGVTATKGVLVIPLSVSFMTVIPLTLREKEDLASRITVEARKYIPLPLQEVALDWTELPPRGEANPTLKEVLVAAIERSTIKEYKDTLAAIKMASQPSEIEAFSLVRALSKSDDTTLAVLDLGAKTSKLYIMNGGTIERIHRVAAGGAAVTKRLAELQSVSFAEAENMKRNYVDGAPYVRDVQSAVGSVFGGVFQEFARIMGEYEARTGAPIARIALSGGASAFPGMEAYATDALSRTAEIGNPFDKVAYPAFMEDTLSTLAPSFGVAMGAALRHFTEA